MTEPAGPGAGLARRALLLGGAALAASGLLPAPATMAEPAADRGQPFDDGTGWVD